MPAQFDNNNNVEPARDGSIPITLGLNVLFFLVAVGILYQFLRSRSPWYFWPRLWKKGDTRPFMYSAVNFQWITKSLMATQDETAMRTGMYGLLYLRMQEWMFFYVIFMAVLVLCIILPINIAANGSDDKGFVQTTATNVPEKSYLLFAHATLIVLFVVVGCLLIYFYTTSYLRAKSLFRGREFVNSHTVKIYGIPTAITSSPELFEFMQKLYPHEIASAHIAFSCPELLSLKRKKNHMIRRLDRARDVLSVKGKRRQRVCNGCCCNCFRYIPACCTCIPREDAISYYEESILYVSDSIRRLQEDSHPTTGSAFVTFYQESKSRFQPGKWSVSRATNPSDVYWKNLQYSRLSQFCRRVIVSIGVFIFAFLWAVPISFLASANTLTAIPGLGVFFRWLFDSNYFVRHFFEGYLPSLLTSLMVLILPPVLRFICQWEKPHSLSSLNSSVNRNYYMFLLFNVLLWPTLLIGSFSAYADIAENGFDTVLDIDFSVQGSYFINYLIAQTFFSGSLKLLRLHPYWWRWWRQRFRALTPQEREEFRAETSYFEFRRRIPQLMICINIVQVYAVVVPLILPVAVVFFIAHYIFDKNNLMYVLRETIELDNSMIPTAVNEYIVGLIVYQALMCMFLWFKGMFDLFGILVAVGVISLVFWLEINLIFYMADRRYITRGQPEMIQWDLPESVLMTAYLHPGLFAEEENIREIIQGTDITIKLETAVDREEKKRRNFRKLNGSLATSTGDGDSIWQSDEEEEHSSSLEEHISSEGREMGEDMRSEGLEA